MTSLRAARRTLACRQPAQTCCTTRTWLRALLVTLVLGITCFAALGLAISNVISNANASGAVTNGIYIPIALVSGTFDASLRLPHWLDLFVSLLPIKALTDGLRAGFDPNGATWPVGDLLVLAVWAVIGVVLARRYFRWEPRRS